MTAYAPAVAEPGPPLRTLEPSDERLLERVAARDADALAALYDRYRALAFGVALRILGDRPAAEDALQEAFLGAWRLAGGYDPARGSARSWILAIVHHRAIDALRRRRPAEALPEPAAVTPPTLIAPEVWPEVLGRVEAAAVRTALADLPAAQRESIELAYWGGLSQSEISGRLGVPLGTVKSRMRLGLLGLRRRLSGDGPDADALPDPSPDAEDGPPARGLRSLASALRSLIGAVGLGRIGTTGCPA